MRAEVKQLWVKALLSGDFRQAKGKLGEIGANGATAHDCLGVLCEVAIRHGVPVARFSWWREGSSITYDKEPSYLPDRVVEWAGLDNRKPVVRVSYEDPGTGELLANRDAALTSINDGVYRDMGIPGDFRCIAEIITANF